MTARSRDLRACARFAPVLSAREGEVTPAERAALSEHLAGCDGCRARLADERALEGMVAEALARAAARRDFSSFADEVLARVEAGREGPWRGLWRRHRRGMAWAAALAPALAAVALLVYLERDALQEGPPPVLVEVVSEEHTTMVLETRDGPLVLFGDGEEGKGT